MRDQLTIIIVSIRISEYLLIASRSRVRLLVVWWRSHHGKIKREISHGGGFDQHGEIHRRQHRCQMINGFGDGCSLVGAFEDGEIGNAQAMIAGISNRWPMERFGFDSTRLICKGFQDNFCNFDRNPIVTDSL